MSHVVMLYFAGVRDLVGRPEEELALPEGTERLSQLVEVLVHAHPELRERLASVRFAVNETFASLDDPIAPGDVVAVIPPVAGG